MSTPVHYTMDQWESLKDLHQRRCKEIVEDTIVTKGLKDGGTCVMGEGIFVWVLPSRRHKYPVKQFLVEQPFQGNNRPALLPALQYLRAVGVDAHYDCGRMD